MVLVTSVMTIGEEEHAAAIVVALSSLEEPALTLGEVKARRDAGTLPTDYVEVTVTRRGGDGAAKRAGRHSRAGYRATTRAVSSVVEGNAQSMRRRSRAALEGLKLEVAEHLSTPITFETADLVGPDDGWWSGIDYWTYVT